MSLGPTANPNVEVTGKVLPGIVKTGQSPRKDESLSVSKVADITTTFKGKDLPSAALPGLENIFFNRPRRISCKKIKHVHSKIDVNKCINWECRSYKCRYWSIALSTHRVEAAFVDLVQDDHAVLREHGICQDLSEQTAVRHVLHRRALAPETHLVSGSRHSQHQTLEWWWGVVLSPVTCSHQSALGSQPLYPECSASPGPPAGPPWWRPPGGAEWFQFCHLYRNLLNNNNNIRK